MYRPPSAHAARIWSHDSSLELSHCRVRHSFPLHFHAEIVVAVIVDGAETVSARGTEQLAQAGSIVVFEPECAHRNAPIGAGGVCYRGFYLQADRARCSDPRRLRDHVLHHRMLARRLLELHHLLEAAASPALTGDAVAVLSSVLDAIPRQPTTHSIRDELRAVAHTLRERCHERLRWPVMARSVGVSAAHLARSFSSHYGLPPHAYQVQHRIARAKQLLRSRRPVATVAAETGFADQSHLTHQFTTFVGQTPGAYVQGQKITRS